MACGIALKRPYDYESYVSPEDTIDSKRRCTNTGCSPFRPFLGTLAASLPNASVTPVSGRVNTGKETSIIPNSPFAVVSSHVQLSPGQLQSYLKAEVRSLKRRRILPKQLFVECTAAECSRGGLEVDQKRAGHTADVSGSNSESRLTNGYRMMLHSPTANMSSDSDGETASTNPPFFKQRLEAQLDIFEKPQFSLKQVQLVCERLLKQQEIRIRFEYETKLNKLMQEQHDQFVQFTKEQERQQLSPPKDQLSYYS